ncbi:hypothetical protein C8R42DRAFT_741111 [Lentinula raphanica]|nr:hypothetical protein C8R42DRAFT_741111 [Lentinula raphanica]
MMLSVRRQVWTGTGLVLSVLFGSVVLTSAYPMGHSDELADSAPPPSGPQHHAPHAGHSHAHSHPHSEAVIDLGSSTEKPLNWEEERVRACKICSAIAEMAWEKLGFSDSGRDTLHCTGYPGDWTFNGKIEAVLTGSKICPKGGCKIEAQREEGFDSPFYDGEITYVGVDDTGKEEEVVVLEVKRLKVESEAVRVEARKAEGRGTQDSVASHKHHHHHHHHR